MEILTEAESAETLESKFIWVLRVGVVWSVASIFLARLKTYLASPRGVHMLHTLDRIDSGGGTRQKTPKHLE